MKKSLIVITVACLAVVAAYSGPKQKTVVQSLQADPFLIVSQLPDDFSSVAAIIDSQTPWSAYGPQLLQLKTGGQDVFRFYADGYMESDGVNPQLLGRTPDLMNQFALSAQQGWVYLALNSTDLSLRTWLGPDDPALPYIFDTSAPHSGGTLISTRNFGSEVFAVQDDGAIKAGSASAWKFLPVSGGQLIVEVDGQKYAITATPIP